MKFARRMAAFSAVAALVCAAIPATTAAAQPADATLQIRAVNASGAAQPGRQVIASPQWSSAEASAAHGGRSKSRTFKTDSNGRAKVTLKLTSAERASVRSNNDWLNLRVVVLDEAGNPSAIIATTKYLGTKPDQVAQMDAIPDQGLVQLAPARTVQAADTGDSAALVSCTYYWEHYSYPTGYMQVGELHRDFDTTTAKFTYGETADSTVDVVTTSDSEATWTTSGSYHVGNSLGSAVSASATTNNYHWALRTNFVFEKVRLYKDCLGGPTHAWTGSEEMGVSRWAGGGMTLANTLTQPARTSANTDIYGPNTAYHRTSQHFVRWSQAIGFLGFSLGASSGASSEVRLDYVFGSRATHYLYGSNGLPSVAARVFQDTP